MNNTDFNIALPYTSESRILRLPLSFADYNSEFFSIIKNVRLIQNQEERNIHLTVSFKLYYTNLYNIVCTFNTQHTSNKMQ